MLRGLRPLRGEARRIALEERGPCIEKIVGEVKQALKRRKACEGLSEELTVTAILAYVFRRFKLRYREEPIERLLTIDEDSGRVGEGLKRGLGVETELLGP